jgi:hypothetical protein
VYVCVRARSTLQRRKPRTEGGEPFGAPLRFRSIALEGGRSAAPLYVGASRWLGVPEDASAGGGGDGAPEPPSNAKQAWLQGVLQQLGPGSMVGGYPTLLCRAFKAADGVAPQHQKETQDGPSALDLAQPGRRQELEPELEPAPGPTAPPAAR